MARVFTRLKKQVVERRSGPRDRWVPLKVEVYETLGDVLELFHYVTQDALAKAGDNPSEAVVNLQAAYFEFREKLGKAVKP